MQPTTRTFDDSFFCDEAEALEPWPAGPLTDLLLSDLELPPHAAGGYPVRHMTPNRAVAQLVPALVHDAAAESPMRSAVAEAVRAATRQGGRRLPADGFVIERTQLVDLATVLCRDEDGVRPIDAALARRDAHLAECRDDQRELLGAAYDALALLADAPTRLYELQSSVNDGRAWVRPLGGGQKVVAEVRVPGARRMGDLLVGRLIAPTTRAVRGEPASVARFAMRPLGFAGRSRAAVVEALAVHGASIDDCDAAMPALFALCVERQLACDAEAVREERRGLPEGAELWDCEPCVALYACEDPDALAVAAVEAGYCSSWDATSACVMVERAGDRPMMATLRVDDGEIWLRGCDDDDIDFVAAALRALDAGALEPLPLVPTDDDGALVDIH